MNGACAAEAPPKRGGKVRLLTLADLDQRTRAAACVREARNEVIADLGGEEQLSTLERVAVDNVVLNAAMLKDLGVRWLRGEGVDAAEIATLQNTFNRTASQLGWRRRSRDITPHLHDYLQAKEPA